MKTIHIALMIEEEELGPMGMVGLMATILSSSPAIRQATGIKDPGPPLKTMTEERNAFCVEAHERGCKLDCIKRESKILNSYLSSMGTHLDTVTQVLHG